MNAASQRAGKLSRASISQTIAVSTHPPTRAETDPRRTPMMLVMAVVTREQVMRVHGGR